MDAAVSTIEAFAAFFSLGNAGYTIQSRIGIPDTIGFFSKPGLDLCQFGEGILFSMLIFGLFGFVDTEIRARYRSTAVLSEKEGTCRGLIREKGNGRFLAVVLVVPYLVAMILRAVFLFGHPDYLV